MEQSVDLQQAKRLKDISNSGRAIRSLGFLYFILSLLAIGIAVLSIRGFNNPEFMAIVGGLPIVMILISLVGVLCVTGFLGLAGTHIWRFLTADTALYLKIALAYSILFLVHDSLRFRINFDLILHLLFFYYALRGVLLVKKVPLDMTSHDPRRKFVLGLAIVGIIANIVIAGIFF